MRQVGAGGAAGGGLSSLADAPALPQPCIDLMSLSPEVLEEVSGPLGRPSFQWGMGVCQLTPPCRVS